ncbi:MAG: prolipoprotein diacylglyceryl transferase [Planctomycetota bacterium]
MHPILIRVPLWGGRHFDIATYGVMMALGTIFAVLAAYRLCKREGIKGETAVDVAFWAVLGGIAGAKLWYIIQYWGEYQDKWELFRNFRSGLVWYGGVVGGTLAIIAYTRARRLALLRVLDFCAPASALGLAFGRIGCFFNGCCYGVRTDGPLGVCFRKVTEDRQIIGSPAFLDHLAHNLVDATAAAALPVIPTQLLGAAGVLAVFALLLLLRKRRRFYGEQTALLFVFYGALRFGLEFLRGDHERSFAGLTAAQVFSLATLVVAMLALLYLRAARPAGLAVSLDDPSRGGTTGRGEGSKD